MIPLILRLDVSGQPLGWMPWQQAVMMYARDRVCWTAGDHVFKIYGGVSRMTGHQSVMEINSIVAVKGFQRRGRKRGVPPLNNQELFKRDGGICMYCGQGFAPRELTRDHVIPRSRGGPNCWTNVVTSCKPCNNRKGDRLLSECGMSLLALPYAPNQAEYLALINSGRILGDQMAFLKQQFKDPNRHYAV